MSTGPSRQASTGPFDAEPVVMHLEVVVVPVADVDRAKEFYRGLGWRLDADVAAESGFRLVQFTPPGSGCSVQFGSTLTPVAPGGSQGLYLVVADVEAARGDLVARGVDVSEVFRGARCPVPSGRSHPRSVTRSRQLRLLRHLLGSGWQRLAVAGGDDSASGPHRSYAHLVRIRR